jgi:hypothetical protein
MDTVRLTTSTREPGIDIRVLSSSMVQSVIDVPPTAHALYFRVSIPK